MNFHIPTAHSSAPLGYFFSSGNAIPVDVYSLCRQVSFCRFVLSTFTLNVDTHTDIMPYVQIRHHIKISYQNHRDLVRGCYSRLFGHFCHCMRCSGILHRSMLWWEVSLCHNPQHRLSLYIPGTRLCTYLPQSTTSQRVDYNDVVVTFPRVIFWRSGWPTSPS